MNQDILFEEQVMPITVGRKRNAFSMLNMYEAQKDDGS